jgi:thiamine biosynthesis lipoprotein
MSKYLFLILCGIAPASAGPLTRYTFTEVHMGTRFKIIVYAPDEASASKGTKAAFARIAQLDSIMSDYKPASELMQLCAKAGGPPVRVSEELFFVLEKAQQVSRRSEGAFDVTVGPVVREWRFARKAQRLPDPDELKEAVSRVGYSKMVLDASARTVQLKQAKMQLDLGGIGKGYAADEAVKVLREHGLPRVLVAAAGDIAAGDPPPDAKGWNVGIAPVAGPRNEPKRFVLLNNNAVSTSGDAEQYVEVGGKRYSHIVDPRTGEAILGQFSATVTAKRGIDSDSLAKVVAVLGPEKGFKVIEETEGAAALFVRKIDGKEELFRSKRFKLREPRTK